MPGDLTGLSAARRALGRWLGDRGVEDEVRQDLVLAASEALANAGEHGSAGDASATVRLQAWLTPGVAGGEVLLQVSDAGRWQHGSEHTDRGRGMRIMAALVDEVDVRTDPGTTVRLRRRLGVAS